MKDKDHIVDADTKRESDEVIVPEKHSNKGAPAPAEKVEGRASVERNALEKALALIQSSPARLYGLKSVRNKATDLR